LEQRRIRLPDDPLPDQAAAGPAQDRKQEQQGDADPDDDSAAQ